MQSVYLQAEKRWDDFGRSGMAFESWLIRLSLNCLFDDHDYQSRKRRDYRAEIDWPDRSSMQVAMGLQAPGTTPSERFARQELHERIDQILGKLPRDYQEILVMIHFGELSRKEAAEILGIPDGTARQRYARGRARFRAEWKRCFGDWDLNHGDHDPNKASDEDERPPQRDDPTTPPDAAAGNVSGPVPGEAPRDVLQTGPIVSREISSGASANNHLGPSHHGDDTSDDRHVGPLDGERDERDDEKDEVFGAFLEELEIADNAGLVIERFSAAYPEWASDFREEAGLNRLLDGLHGPRIVHSPEQFPDIVRWIATGGMGVLYEAEQLALGRRVALKVRHGSASAASRIRFEREQRVHSPNGRRSGRRGFRRGGLGRGL